VLFVGAFRSGQKRAEDSSVTWVTMRFSRELSRSSDFRLWATAESEGVTIGHGHEAWGEDGRAGEIRTLDLLHPMQARYQTTLRPDESWSGSRMHRWEASGFLKVFSEQTERDFRLSISNEHAQYSATEGRPPCRPRL
jgi:hypothetical protein